jgi:hypothetical protein
MAWLLIPIGAVVVIGLALSRLRRPFVGLGLTLLGGILGGVLTFGAAMFWLVYLYTPPRPRNDSDWSGLEVPLFFVVVVPFGCTILGILLGLGFSFWREWHPPAKPLEKPEPLDL